MSKKNLRNSWRRGDMGIGQIAAVLLIVLPTLAFSVTFLISYWGVMQVDYKLKLIANMTADYLNEKTDITNYSGPDFQVFHSRVSKLCPKGQAMVYKDIKYTEPKGVISITVEYTTPATETYFANKTISTHMETYSYHDQNMSVVLQCPTI